MVSNVPLLSDTVSSEEEPSAVDGSSLSPHPVLCLLLGVLTVVSIAVTLSVWVLEFLLFWGKCGCLQKQMVSLLSKTLFINAVVRPLSGTGFWGYPILHLCLVRMAAVGLT